METIDQDQAGAAASLLSLDVTAPLHAAMGMRVDDGAQLVTIMRELICAHRRAFERTGIAPDTLAPEMIAAVDDRGFTRWLRHLHFEVPYQQLQWCYWMAGLRAGASTPAASRAFGDVGRLREPHGLG